MRGPVGKTVRVGRIGPGGEYAGVHIGAKRTTRVQPPRRAAVSLKELSMSRYPSIPPTPPAYTTVHPTQGQAVGTRQAAPRLLSATAATAYLGVSANTVRKYRDEGKIRAFHVGERLVRYDPEDLDRFMSEFGG
jgi:excisionase family DNA binding protein